MRRYTVFFLFFLSIRIAAATEGVWVVANVENQAFSLTKAEIRNLYMKSGTTTYELEPVAMSPGNIVRSIFNAKIIALPESRIQSYWAQMRFSGRQAPPVEYDSLEEVINYINNHEGAVGYVPANTVLPENVSVVYRSF